MATLQRSPAVRTYTITEAPGAVETARLNVPLFLVIFPQNCAMCSTAAKPYIEISTSIFATDSAINIITFIYISEYGVGIYLDVI